MGKNKIRFLSYLLVGSIVTTAITIPPKSPDIKAYATDEVQTTANNINVVIGVHPDCEGQGTVTGDSGTMPTGSTITVEATPADGYKFLGWYNAGTTKLSTDNPYKPYLVRDSVIYARFIENSYRYSASVAVDGQGRITSSAGGLVNYKSQFTISCEPAAGYKFIGWYVGDTLVSTNQTETFTMGKSDIDYIARFDTTDYLFDAISSDESKGTVVAENGRVNYKVSVTATATAKTGWEFQGWYNRQTGAEEGTDPTITITMPGKDYLIEARFTPKKYNIYFNNANNNSVTQNYYLSPIGNHYAPTVTGRTFSHWELNGERVDADYVHPVYEDITLTAIYTPNKYLVTLHDSMGINTVESYEVAYMEKYPELPKLTKYGYIHLGWKNLDGIYVNSGTTQKSITTTRINAEWKPKDVAHYIYDRQGNLTDVFNIPFGTSNTGLVPTASSDNNGYVFRYWICDGTRFELSSSIDYEEEKHLYPHFEPVGMNVRFNTGHNGSVHDPIQVPYKSTIGELPTPTRSGYKFEYWKCNGVIVDENFTIDLIQEYVLEAVWTPLDYNISFVTNTETELDDMTISYCSQYVNIPSLTRIGYNFIGWKIVELDTMFYMGMMHTETRNLTFEAIWEPIKYYIILDTNQGVLSELEYEVHYGLEIGELPTPTKRGYKFSHWEINDTQVNEEDIYYFDMNVEAVAIYTPNGVPISITYDDSMVESITKDFIDYVEYDSVINVSAKLKQGYKVVGWYINGTRQSTEIAFQYGVTADTVSIELVTCPVTAIITFSSSATNVSNPTQIEQQYGSTFTGLPTITRPGYDFLGWYYEDTKYENGDTSLFVNGIQLSARWSSKFIPIRFNVNDSIVESLDTAVLFDGTYGYLPTPIKDGHTFRGWRLNSPDGNFIVSQSIVNTPDEHTLYAHFDVNSYKLRVNYNNNTPTNTFNVTYGQEYTLTAPTIDGRIFKSWSIVSGMIDSSVNLNNKSITFNMPSKDISMAVTWASIVNIDGKFNSNLYTKYPELTDNNIFYVDNGKSYNLTPDHFDVFSKYDSGDSVKLLYSDYTITPTIINSIEQEYVKITSKIKAADGTFRTCYIPITVRSVSNESLLSNYGISNYSELKEYLDTLIDSNNTANTLLAKYKQAITEYNEIINQTGSSTQLGSDDAVNINLIKTDINKLVEITNKRTTELSTIQNLIVTAGGNLGNDFELTDGEYDTIINQINTLSNDYSRVKSELLEATSDLDSIKNKLNISTDASTEDVLGAIEQLQNRIEEYETIIKSYELEIDDIIVHLSYNISDEDKDSINSRLAYISGQISLYNTKITSITNTINSIKSSINKLASDDVEIEDINTSTLESALSGIETSLSKMKDKIDKVELSKNRLADILNLSKTEYNLDDLVDFVEDLKNDYESLSDSYIYYNNILTNIINNLGTNSGDDMLAIDIVDAFIGDLINTLATLNHTIIETNNDLYNDIGNNSTEGVSTVTNELNSISSNIYKLISISKSNDTFISNLRLLLGLGENTSLGEIDVAISNIIASNSNMLASLNNISKDITSIYKGLTGEDLTDGEATDRVAMLNTSVTEVLSILSTASSLVDMLYSKVDVIVESSPNNITENHITGMIQRLVNNINVINERVDSVNYDINKLREVLGLDENATLQEIVDNVTKLKEDYELYKEMIDKVNNLINSGGSSSESLKTTLDMLYGKIESIDTQIKNAESMLSEKFGEEISLGNLDNLTSLIDSIKSDLQDSLSEIESLRNSNAEKDEQIDILNASVEELRNEIVALREEVSNKDLVNAELMQDIVELNERISTLEQTIQVLTSEKDLAIEEQNRLQNELVTTKESLNNVTKQNEEYVELISNLNEMISSKDDSITELNQTIENLSTEISTLKSNKEELQTELNEALSKVEELTNSNQTNNELIGNLNDRIAELESEISSINSINQTLTSTNETLTNQVNTLTSERDTLSTQVSELNNTVTSLQSQISALSARVLELEEIVANCPEDILLERISELEEQVETLQDDKVTLTKQLEESINERNNLNTTISQLTTDNEALTTQISILNSDKESLIADKESLNQQIENLTTNRDSLLEQLEDTVLAKEELTNQINSMTEEKNNLTAQVNTLSERIAQLEAKIEAGLADPVLLEELQSLRNEKVTLTNRIKEAEQVIDGLKQEYNEVVTANNSLKAENESLRTDKENLNIEINNLNSQKDALSAQITEITEQVNSLTTERNNLLTDKETLSNQVSNLTSDKKSLNDRITELNNKVTEYETTISSLSTEKNKLNTEINSLKIERDTLLANKETLDNQIANLNTEKETLTNNIATLNSKITKYEKDIASLKDEKETLESNNNSLQTDKENLQSEKESLLANKAQLEADKVQLQSKISEYENTISTLQAEKNTLSQKISELNGQIETLRQEKENALTNNTQLTKQIQTLTSEKNSLINELNSVNANLSSLTNEKNKLTEDLGKANENINKLNKDIANLNIDIAELNTAISTLESDKATLVNTIATLESEKAEMSTTISTLESEKAEMTNTISTLEASKTELQNKVSTLESNKAELQSKVSTLEASNKELQNKVSTLESSKAELQTKVSTLESEKSDMSNKISTLETNKAELQNTISTLESNKKELESKVSTLESSKTKMSETISKLESEKAQLQNKVSTLETNKAELENKISKLESEKAKLNETISTMESEKAKLNETISTLKAERDEMSETISTLQNEKAQLNTQLTEVTNSLLSKNNELVVITGKYDALVESNNSLNNSYNELEISYGNLTTERDNAISRITELEEQVLDLSTKLNTVSTEKDTLSSNYAILETEKNTLSEKNTILTNANTELTAKVSTLLDDKVALNKQIDSLLTDKQNLVNQVASLQNEIKVLSKDIEDVFNKNEALDKNLYDVIVERDKLTEQVTNFNKQIETLNGTIKELTEANNKLTEDNGKLQTDLSTANTNNSLLNAELESKNEIITSLEANIETLNSDNAKLDETVNKLNVQIETLNGNITNLTNELNNAVTNNNSLIKEIDTYKNTVTNLSNNIETLEKDKQTLTDRIVELTNTINLLDVDKNALSTQVATLQAEKEVLLTNATKLNEQIEVLNKEIEKLKKDVETLESANPALKTENDSLVTENNKLQSMISKLDGQVEKLKLQLAEAGTDTSEIDELQNQIKKLNNTISSLTSANESLSSEVDELLTELNKLKQEAGIPTTTPNKPTDNTNNSNTGLSTELELLNKAYAELEAKYNKVIAEDKEYINRLETNVNTLINRINILIKDNLQLKAMINNSTGNNSTGNNSTGNNSTGTSSQDVQQMANSVIDSINNLLNNNRNLDEATLIRLNQMITLLSDSIKDVEGDIITNVPETDKDRVILELREKVANLESSYANAVKELDVVKKQASDYSKQAEYNRSVAERLQKEKTELNNVNAELKQRLQNSSSNNGNSSSTVIACNHTDYESLKQQVSVLNQAIKQKDTELNTVKKNNTGLMTDNNELLDEVEILEQKLSLRDKELKEMKQNLDKSNNKVLALSKEVENLKNNQNDTTDTSTGFTGSTDNPDNSTECELCEKLEWTIRELRNEIANKETLIEELRNSTNQVSISEEMKEVIDATGMSIKEIVDNGYDLACLKLLQEIAHLQNKLNSSTEPTLVDGTVDVGDVSSFNGIKGSSDEDRFYGVTETISNNTRTVFIDKWKTNNGMLQTDGKSSLASIHSMVSYDTLDTVRSNGFNHGIASTYNDVVFYQIDSLTGYTTTYVVFEVVYNPMA